MKAIHARDAKKLEDIPNIGPRIANDLELLGIKAPLDLKGKDAYTLYQKMNALSGTRNDPCLLDVFIAAVDFMNGAPARPWYAYTKRTETPISTDLVWH